jgi:hypothetical protein
MKTSISCGMPLRGAADHAREDIKLDYCKHCADAEGRLKSYGDVLHGMTQFLCRTQGIEETAAAGIARETMSRMAAWRT